MQKSSLIYISLCLTTLLVGCKCGPREHGLNTRVSQLMDWSFKRPVIKMNGDKFRQYVKNTQKNYSVILMLTALHPERQCQICKQANEEFSIVANSWRYSPQHDSRLFFASVDFDDGNDVFTYLKLSTAPVFIHFPPKSKPKALDHLDIQRVGLSAETMARWIAERTDIQIRVFRPPNYSGTLLLLVLGMFVGTLLYFKRDNLEFLYNKTAWGVIALAIMLCMTSGQMWNHIRGPPFMHRNPNTGELSYIHGGSGFQLAAESYIVIALNIAIVFGMVLLNEAKDLKKDVSTKRIISLVGIGVVCVFFSLLLSVFRSKYQGYPYSFLFK